MEKLIFTPNKAFIIIKKLNYGGANNDYCVWSYETESEVKKSRDKSIYSLKTHEFKILYTN
jgi:hypothetical protein